MNKAATAKRKENAVVRYLKETRAEVRKVTWPTVEEARTLTVVVLAATVAMALYLGFLDLVLTWLMAAILG